jgi:hypothetical protein
MRSCRRQRNAIVAIRVCRFGFQEPLGHVVTANQIGRSPKL